MDGPLCRARCCPRCANLPHVVLQSSAKCLAGRLMSVPKKKTLYCTPPTAASCSCATAMRRFCHRSADWSTSPNDLDS